MNLSLTTAGFFQNNPIPPGTKLTGWSALAHTFTPNCPVRHPACVSHRHVKGSLREVHGWRIFDLRYWPGTSFADHLNFALRHETLDLLLLKRIFEAVAPSLVREFVRQAPLGVSNRRAWFLYEMLLGTRLDIPDAPSMKFIDLLDGESYFTAKPLLSARHRVRNNLLGPANFCPIIRRTSALQHHIKQGLSLEVGDILGRTRAQLVARAASFLLLADSRASFQIEGERPSRSRLERWGRAVFQAGRNPLQLAELLRVHSILVEDNRFVQPGLRSEGVFLGERDVLGDPLPEFIGARPQDLEGLMEGLLQANLRMSEAKLDPVLQAAAIAFGFVYIHPFQDGNGRMHRYLIHHVLAERRFTPAGLIFPVSSVLLDQIDHYRQTLRNHSAPLMDLIEWRSTSERNVEVWNDTADIYAYFDCTEAAEFLYGCVQRTVEQDLPREIDYLERYDDAIQRIMNIVEMPDDLAGQLVVFIRQNSGRLGKKRREKEFVKLTDEELTEIESSVNAAFDGFSITPK